MNHVWGVPPGGHHPQKYQLPVAPLSVASPVSSQLAPLPLQSRVVSRTHISSEMWLKPSFTLNRWTVLSLALCPRFVPDHWATP